MKDASASVRDRARGDGADLVEDAVVKRGAPEVVRVLNELRVGLPERAHRRRGAAEGDVLLLHPGLELEEEDRLRHVGRLALARGRGGRELGALARALRAADLAREAAAELREVHALVREMGREDVGDRVERWANRGDRLLDRGARGRAREE